MAHQGRGRDALLMLPPAALLVAMWAVSRVSAGDIALHVAYQAAFVVGPGVLIFAALTREHSALRLLAFGWAVGLAVEILAFVVTAALDVRAVFPFLPPALAVFAGWRVWRARGAPGAPAAAAGPGVPLMLPVVISVALVLVAATLIPLTPLPGTASPAAYDTDTLFYLSIAGDALQHWPPENPSLAGTELPYHTFAMAHMAAESQVAGIDLAVILLRLHVLTLAFVLMLCLAASVQGMGAGGAGMVLAVAITVLVGELDLSQDELYPFRGLLFEEIVQDPTTLLGLVFFAAAFGLLWDRLASDVSPRHAAGAWLALALVLVGSVGSKASGIPILLAGLGLVAAWRWLRERRLPVNAVGGAALVLAVLAGSLLLLYGSESGGASIDPGAGIQEMSFIARIASDFPYGGLWDIPVWSALTVLAMVGVAGAQLAGALLGLRRAVSDPAGPEAWLAALTLAGLAPFLLLTMRGEAQVYFLVFAVVPGSLLSALTLERVAWRGRSPGQRTVIAGTAAAVATLGLAVALLTGDTSSTVGPLLRALLACLAVVAAIAVAFGLRRPRARLALPVLAAGVVALGALDAPLDTLTPLYEARADGRVAYPREGRGLTDNVHSGLLWVREHTPEETLLAVNNHFTNDLGTDPRTFLYSAFAYRRFLLQSWGYTVEAAEVGYDETFAGALAFPRLTRLNAAAFAGDRAAVAQLRRRGVDFLLVDTRYRPAAVDRLARLGRRVYRNPEIAVFDIRSAPSRDA